MTDGAKSHLQLCVLQVWWAEAFSLVFSAGKDKKSQGKAHPFLWGIVVRWLGGDEHAYGKLSLKNFPVPLRSDNCQRPRRSHSRPIHANASHKRREDQVFRIESYPFHLVPQAALELELERLSIQLSR
ncbi:hypothetical protein H4582DRAFT_2036561 [Lactarius indigo]|nr:hypothetical protein H4582DRAFT_2036561 [Lactarius indigo]